MQSNQHSRFQRISGTISNAKTKIKRIWNEESPGPEFRFKNINMLIHLFRLIFFEKFFKENENGGKLWLPLATLMWHCKDVEWWSIIDGDKNGPSPTSENCHQRFLSPTFVINIKNVEKGVWSDSNSEWNINDFLIMQFLTILIFTLTRWVSKCKNRKFKNMNFIRSCIIARCRDRKNSWRAELRKMKINWIYFYIKQSAKMQKEEDFEYDHRCL